MAIERHGFTLTERQMSPQAATPAAYSLIVAVGTSPVNQSKRVAPLATPVNVPILARTYDEAVNALGFSNDFENFTLSEVIDSHFNVHRQGSPILLINTLDPAEHTEEVEGTVMPIVKRKIALTDQGVILSSVVVQSSDSSTTYTAGTDYSVAFDAEGQAVITVSRTGTVPQDENSLRVGYTKLDPSAVGASEIIGGTDPITGSRTGLDLVENVFPLFQLAPTYIIAPGYSQDPLVASAMVNRSLNINGMFEGQAVTDLDPSVRYTDIIAWKEDNGYRSPNQINTYPMARRSGKMYRMSTLYVGAASNTNAINDGVPAESASNKFLGADELVYSDGTPMVIGKNIADDINAAGIVTGLNFTGNFVAWGNRTGAFPEFTDPQRAFIPVRSMFAWVKNNFAVQFWSKVDSMLSDRVIQEITDGGNFWINGLVASGYLLGGRIEFRQSENPSESLLQGKARFNFYMTPPGPLQEIEGIFEYDLSYLNVLFGPQA